jgi:phage shock protein A
MDPRAREALQLAIAVEHSLHQQMRHQEQLVDRWQARAELAARRGEEDLAREALARKADHERRAAQFGSDYLAQAELVRKARTGFVAPQAARIPQPRSLDAELNKLAGDDRLEKDLAALKQRLGVS